MIFLSQFCPLVKIESANKIKSGVAEIRAIRKDVKDSAEVFLIFIYSTSLVPVKSRYIPEKN